MFDSAGKNMRRLSGELLTHFRNLVVLQALGPESKSLAATPDQIKVLENQAQGVDPGRVFKVCDQIAEMEDKLRYVLSVRTLIEMSLIRASRIATTATVEELMRAVKALKEGGVPAVPATPVAPVTTVAFVAPVEQLPRTASPVAPAEPMTRKEVLDDDTLNEVLGEIPGATITAIHETRRRS